MTYQLSSEEEFAHRAESLLDSLAKDATRRGWTFYVEPPRDMVPDFVGDYQPDAMAITPDGGVIIEITDRRGLAQRGRLAEIARIVSQQPGWSFRVFYANPSDQSGVSPNAPTLAEVKLSIDEARALHNAGQERAALVMGWAALEAISRLIMSLTDREGTRPISLSQSIQLLIQEGYLDDKDADLLRHLVRLRNEVLHGGVSTTVSAEEAEQLIKYLDLIAEGLPEAA